MKSEPTGMGVKRGKMPDFPGRVLRMWLDGNDERGNQKGISGLREGPNPQN